MDSKTEAKLAAEELERKLREGTLETDESLKMWLDTWLKEYKKGTFDKHEMNIRTRILPYFQGILLKESYQYGSFIGFSLKF